MKFLLTYNDKNGYFNKKTFETLDAATDYVAQHAEILPFKINNIENLDCPYCVVDYKNFKKGDSLKYPTKIIYV